MGRLRRISPRVRRELREIRWRIVHNALWLVFLSSLVMLSYLLADSPF